MVKTQSSLDLQLYQPDKYYDRKNVLPIYDFAYLSNAA